MQTTTTVQKREQQCIKTKLVVFKKYIYTINELLNAIKNNKEIKE